MAGDSVVDNGVVGNRVVGTVRIATRASALARWQADHVAALLRATHPALTVEIVAVSTEGDRRVDVPLSEIGGKGVFATEVQAALLDGRADVAVHSAKDLPALTPPDLVLAAIPTRGEPADALVGSTLDGLRQGAVVATGSARRRAQLAHLRPDLEFAELRGNMATRLSKASNFDAIVVAAVAFDRLDMSDQLTDRLDVSVFVPQVGQGALGVECRSTDETLIELVRGIEDPLSRRCVDAERAFLEELGGDCSLPAGAHAVIEDGADGGPGTVHLEAILASDVGAQFARCSVRGADGYRLGRESAQRLRAEIAR